MAAQWYGGRESRYGAQPAQHRWFGQGGGRYARQEYGGDTTMTRGAGYQQGYQQGYIREQGGGSYGYRQEPVRWYGAAGGQGVREEVQRHKQQEAPVVVEVRKPHEIRETEEVVERERFLEEIQPVIVKRHELVNVPEEVVEEELPRQVIEFKPSRDLDVGAMVQSERQRYLPSRTQIEEQVTVEQRQRPPMVAAERVHRRIIEDIQPIITREVQQTRVVHQIRPVLERVIEQPRVLPAVVKEERQQLGYGGGYKYEPHARYTRGGYGQQQQYGRYGQAYRREQGYGYGGEQPQWGGPSMATRSYGGPQYQPQTQGYRGEQTFGEEQQQQGGPSITTGYAQETTRQQEYVREGATEVGAQPQSRTIGGEQTVREGKQPMRTEQLVPQQERQENWPSSVAHETTPMWT